MADTYHHGDLRSQVLSSAAELIEDEGADALSLRELARRAGVSHAAPAHHFGDKRGLFTSLAAEGFNLLANVLEASVTAQRFDLTAVDYVLFAIHHRGHYAIMFRPDLLDSSDSTLAEARLRSTELLQKGLNSVSPELLHTDPNSARKAAWAMVHGLASLINAGALPDADPGQLAKACAQQLFGD